MRYKQPVITQEMLVHVWASYQMYVADCETVLRLLRNGSEIEHGPMAVNCRALKSAIPDPLALTGGQELESCRARRFDLLSHLLDGADVSALKSSGVSQTAQRQRRANARLFTELARSLRADISNAKDSVFRLFGVLKTWRRSDELALCLMKSAWHMLRLRFAVVLYRLNVAVAQRTVLSALDGLRAVFDSLDALLVDLLSTRTARSDGPLRA
jgi:hypothetical protein